jgi:hypothetical protein
MLGWFAFYMFFRNECGLVEETEDVMGIVAVTNECGWCYLYDECAVICDRYESVYRDEVGRLHSEDGPAVKYRDGFSLYFWHGTQVPDYVIERPEEITLEDIMNESNQEVRRVKIGQFGIENLINSGEVKLIDEDPEFGELYHTKNFKDIDNKPYAFVKVINSTHEIEDEQDLELMQIQGRLSWLNWLVSAPDKTLSEEETKEKEQLEFKQKQLLKDRRLEQKIYTLRVNPSFTSVKEAWQSTFRHIEDFLPIVES